MNEPIDTTRDFIIGLPTPDVQIRVDFIFKAAKSGLLDTRAPTVPTVVIPNPIMRGKKEDWKATAYNLAQKYLHDKKILENVLASRDRAFANQQRANAQLLSELRSEKLSRGLLQSGLNTFRSHWTYKVLARFLPRQLRKCL